MIFQELLVAAGRNTTLLYNRINDETVLHKAVNQGATEIVKVRFSARVYLTQSGVTVIREGGGGGGYSFYVGWYGCVAVLILFFYILGIELDLLGVLFLIHLHQNYLFGY